ncbi:MAG: tRNA (guanosine(18)-2'-O)-methyltransferase TrmH [Chlorobiaceae bacterium]|nr:tRNA (guanosine(18)-2'-O)-methyltransferase TrmH [Chlorobiaceae bacterium]
MVAPERFRKIRELLEKRQTDLTLVMDNVNKAHNLAAIIRSCDAVGIHQVHAISRRSSIRTRQHTAAGANRWVKVSLSDSIVTVGQKLREAGMQTLVATWRPDAIDFRSIDYTRPTAIVMGEELTGPSPEAMNLADHFIYIPMNGMVESLNVSVAAAIILFEAQRQRQTSGLYDIKHFSDTDFERLLFEYTYPRLSAVLRDQNKPYPKLDENGAFNTTNSIEQELSREQGDMGEQVL